MEASRCAYKRNIILNSVRQHNFFILFFLKVIIQATCFDYSHPQAYFCYLSHKMLCTLWDPKDGEGGDELSRTPFFTKNDNFCCVAVY